MTLKSQPMPVIKLTFDKESDYLKAINAEGIRIPEVNHTLVFQKERSFKVIPSQGSAQYGCNSIFQKFSGATKNFAIFYLKIAMS